MAPATATATPRGVALTASGPGSVSFTVTVPAARVMPVAGTEGVSEIQIDGYAASPTLPMRVLQVAVPPGAQVHLTVSASGEEPLDGVTLAKTAAGPPGRAITPAASRGPVAPGRAEAVASPRARLVGVSWMRDQRVATVAILPVDYDPVTHRTTVYHQIEVQLSFAGGIVAGTPAPANDSFEPVYRDVLVNYESGRAWRRSPAAAARAATPAFAGARRLSAAQLQDLGTPAVPDTSVFVGRDWIKIAITQTGFYRVNFGQLRNTSLFSSLPGGSDTSPIDSLRLFTWPGVPVLPEANYCDTCDFREVALQVEETDPADGIFNRNADEITFFAMSPSDWANLYDPSQPESVFVDHPYETRNYYYLTVSTADNPIGRGVPARIPTVTTAQNGTELTPPDFGARVHAEQDIEYNPTLSPQIGFDPTIFWEKWFWRTLSSGNQFSPEVGTPGADSTQLATVHIRQWAIYDVSCFQHLMDVSVNDQPLPRQGWTGAGVPFSYLADIPINALRKVEGNTIKVSIPSDITCDRSALAWIEIRYRSRFEPQSDQLAFDSAPGGGNYLYDIGPFVGPDPPRVYDVTDAYAPIAIAGTTWTQVGAAYRLQFVAHETGQRRYRVIPSASIATVADANVFPAPATSRLNLRSRTRGADYLLIYYDGFQAAADSLAAWREGHLPLTSSSPPYEVATVPISALYDQFSGGRTDPTAIRNFLRAAFYNWQKRPTFVTLLGDASYDFKNIKGLAPAGQPGCLLPTYVNAFTFYPDPTQYATDDWLYNVDNAGVTIPDFYGGRIPAPDPPSALDFVLKKVLFYERSTPTGAWRNKVMLIADDNCQGKDAQGNCNFDPIGWGHLEQTAELDSSHTPTHLDRQYVYLHTYPDGPGSTKPQAKADIKQTINDGVLMANFIGHGSPFKLADETVLSDVDAGTFTNAERPTLFVAASCDVGSFADPVVQSLGERMILAPFGGAVGVISATAIAFSGQNALLNWELYDQIFDRQPAGGQYHVGVAQALFVAKVNTATTDFDITNNSKYQLMGDSGTRLTLPGLWVGLGLYACDTCQTQITEAERGKTVYFRGRVFQDSLSTVPVALDGSADMLIEDSAPLDQASDGVDFWFKAGPMYRGDVTIKGGALQGSFVVPIEAQGGARGRVRAYVSGRAPGVGYDLDGAGSMRVQISPGPPVTGDNEGPRITLSFASGSTTVRPDAQLRVDLTDQSGILITGHTLQNGIVVTLDENTTGRVDITSSFRYLNGSHTTGTAFWNLPNLPAGPHTIRVSAADNLAAGLTAASHRSSATISITVAETPPLQIVNAYLFPNPTESGRGRSGGQFVVDALGDSVNALLRIYTVSGRMIRQIETFGRQGQIQIPWDGLDHEGHGLANGTYFFKVQLNVRDEFGASSPQTKATSDGRFVILNH